MDSPFNAFDNFMPSLLPLYATCLLCLAVSFASLILHKLIMRFSIESTMAIVKVSGLPNTLHAKLTSRTKGRMPPLYAFLDTIALPKEVRGPNECCHGCHV
jgi:hypothetical protein